VDNPPLYVAIHEAGHAVAMLAQQPGPRIDYISIVDQPADRVGIVHAQARFQPNLADVAAQAEGGRPLIERLAWQDAVEFLAGPIAEWRFRKQSKLVRLLTARDIASRLALDNTLLKTGEDAEKVLVRLRWRNPDTVEEEFIAAWEESEALLKPRWTAVQELGLWLHRQGRIEDDQLYDWWNTQTSG